MKRNIDLKQISDGRLYTSNDMVKADCQDCTGCSACCRGMGSSIVLDPLDVWRLCEGLALTFAELMEKSVELQVVDGMILPNLKMREDTEACFFLSGEGRCSIHVYRPGICRLFPLGRYYEEEGFRYFLQVHECARSARGKVKVKKWLDTPELKTYEKYIADWHNFLKACEAAAETLEDAQIRVLNLYVLKMFYQMPYGAEDFYGQFYQRLKEVKDTLDLQ